MNDDTLATPAPQLRAKYQQLYDELKKDLVAGDLSPEQPIATEQKLAEQFGVSRVTVRKALKLLEDEGLIVRKRRLGTFPAERVVPFPGGGNVDELARQTAWLAAHSEVRLLRFDRIAAPKKVRKMLHLPSKGRVLRFARIRFDQSGPIAHLTSYLPSKLAQDMTEQQLLKSPPLVLLEEKGIAAARAEQTVSAELATAKMAGWLEVGEGQPLIRTTRAVMDEQGTPVIYNIARLRADRYELRYTLGKHGAGDVPEVWRLGTD